ncbi:MAG: PLDc N-terminal domain-containing protein [Syntrophales bacterium]|nr:PLDc N-terminal domain-containing protein [Syntrophales bacterium]
MEFILGVIIFIADIWAIVLILQAPGASALAKVLWILLIIILPVVGLIIWWFLGPRASRTPA